MSSQLPIVPPFIAITKATEPTSGLANFDFRISKWHIALGIPGLIIAILVIWAANKAYKNYKRTGRLSLMG